ncbi:M55 family metallopeptidase [Sphingomonas sp. RT2P30]|uniref:M55 family metallopeptidase n=1 Tax=Parasphingomonas halimpatiens TaxID=3096162 RepID=UPI002FCC5C3B
MTHSLSAKRFYISADIEGIAGVASRDNLAPGRFEYEQARDWMTDAVLAACETLSEFGATEVVVSDSHGNGQNIRYERMPEYARLVRSWPRPLGMMQGIESGRYDGALLIGYHAGAGNIGGTLSHTVSGHFFQEIRLNGVPASEALISAAIAGHHGVPVLLVAGDDVAVAETSALLPGIATACLKSSHGFLSTNTLSPRAADRALREGVEAAIGKVGTIEPHVVSGPIDLELRLRSRFMAEWLSYLQGVERIDVFTIRHACPDIVAVSRFLQFLTSAKEALA